MANVELDYIKRKDGSILLPYTSTYAVTDSEGINLDEHLSYIHESIENVISYVSYSEDASYAYISELRNEMYEELNTYQDAAYNYAETKAEEVQLNSYNYADSLAEEKVDKVSGKGLSEEDFTTAYKNKLAGIADGAEVNVQSDWNAASGAAYIKNKPDIPDVSGFTYLSYTTEELDKKVDKVSGKQLSTEDFTTAYKNKLAGIADGAEVNVQSNWNVTDSSDAAYIKNKPTIPSISGLVTVSYVTDELDKKVDKVSGKQLSTEDFTTAYMQKLDRINEGSVNQRADWNVTNPESYSYILNKPNIPELPEYGDSMAYDAASTVADATDDSLPTTYVVRSLISSTYTDTVSYVTTELDKKVDKVSGKQLSTEDFITAYKNKLAGIADGAEVNVQPNWNTSDPSDDAYIKNKPTLGTAATKTYTDTVTNIDSLPTASAVMSYVGSAIETLPNKVDKVSGKGLSTEDFTTAYKNKLAGIADGAEVNVQSNWNVTDSSDAAYIKNKPALGTAAGKNYTDTITNTNDLITADAVASYMATSYGDIVSYIASSYSDIVTYIGAAYDNINTYMGSAYDNITSYMSIAYDSITANVSGQLNNKVDKEAGKGLSTEDFTTAYMQKLDGIDMTYVISYIPNYSKVDVTENLTNVVCPVDIDNYQQCHVIYKNVTDAAYTIAVSTSYTTPDGEPIELSIKAGGYGEINYFKIDGEVFVRAI